MPNNLFEERYHFAVRQAANATRIVQGYLSVLRTGQFTDRHLALTGDWARVAAHWGLEALWLKDRTEAEALGPPPTGE